ncbi:MAG: hypothetical protein DRI61_12395 [Chloroflexi bacterium]|nr:MAG: hypothetical protein DRI61_12395 [Chloroflexota bacterium]
MDTDEDGVTDYIELQGWDVIVIHERRGEVMKDRCKNGVWSLPVRYDSEGDGASDETEWKFHGNPDSSDSDKDGIPDREEPGPNLTMVEGTPPVILDKKGRDKSSDKYSGAYIKTKVKVKTKWSISGVKIKGQIIVIFTVVDNAGLDKAVIYVQTGGERIIYLGGDKRREIEEVFEIGDLLRLIHGGYDVRVNVTDINGNWATGKTHIDSALQTLKKGLSALLDMIVAVLKVIAKVASMLINIIRKIIKQMLEPVLKPIKEFMGKIAENIVNGVEALLRAFGLLENKLPERGLTDSPTVINLDSIIPQKLLKILGIIPIVLIVIYMIISVYTVGVGTVLIETAKEIIVNIITSSLSKHKEKFEISPVKVIGGIKDGFDRVLDEIVTKISANILSYILILFSILGFILSSVISGMLSWLLGRERDGLTKDFNAKYGWYVNVYGLFEKAAVTNDYLEKNLNPTRDKLSELKDLLDQNDEKLKAAEKFDIFGMVFGIASILFSSLSAIKVKNMRVKAAILGLSIGVGAWNAVSFLWSLKAGKGFRNFGILSYIGIILALIGIGGSIYQYNSM